MEMSRLKKGSAVLVALTGLVGGFEGLREYAYRDPVGIPTICFGETRGVQMGDHKTAADCKTMLGDRLIEFSVGVDKCLPAGVPDKPYMAFVSLAYNVGVGAFCRSSIPVKVRAGDLTAACNTILSFNKARGIVLPGLDKRRHVERDLCIEGVAA
jgi:lysozyme